MKSLRLLVLSVALCCMPVGTSAQPRDGMSGGFNRGRMMEELQLTQAQKEALACEVQGQGREIRVQLLTEREELNRILRDAGVPEDEVRTQLDKVNRLQAAWNTHRMEKILQARKVLTPEQLEKLLAMQEQRHGGDQ